ncbi:MAG: radical SAM protein [Thermaerobacter sp.]|nr:radical SAM protein [Thermaerobacter sp.]
MDTHPCYSAQAAKRYGRIHLSVAPRCNLSCRYCDRRFDCANECRPGVTSRVLTPKEAVDLLASAVRRDPRLRVVGFAGPGDPLANEATFRTLELLRGRFPQLSRCLSTNGLLLSERLADLHRVGVDSVTVTLNAVSARVGAAIYAAVRLNGRGYRGEEGAGMLLERQLAGIAAAVAAGMRVKVNAVLIPGVNDAHLPRVARVARTLGVRLMNVMPLYPVGEFAGRREPTAEDLAAVRAACAPDLAQMAHCAQCRADASGLLGPCRELAHRAPTTAAV